MSSRSDRAGNLILLIQGGDNNRLNRSLKADSTHINEFSGEGSSDAMTPLHFAVMLGNVNCVETLIKYGADVNLTVKSGIWKDKTALDIAEACGYDEILDIFENKEKLKVSDDEEILEEYAKKEAALLKMLKEAREEFIEEEANQVKEMQLEIQRLKEQNTLLTQHNATLSEKLKSCVDIISSLKMEILRKKIHD